MRVLLPLYGILGAVTLFAFITKFFENPSQLYSIISGSSYFFFGVCLVVSLVLTTAFAIVRFYKHLFTGEGYLTFTLPVTPAQHILVKLLVAFLAILATDILIGVALFTVVDWDVWVEVMKLFHYLYNQLPIWYGHLWAYGAELLIAALVTVIGTLMTYYFCITVGQLTKKNRILAAVGVYFLCYTITQIFGTFIGVFGTLFIEWHWVEQIATWIMEHLALTIHLAICGSTLVAAAISLAMFFVCRHIMVRKLNLE